MQTQDHYQAYHKGAYRKRLKNGLKNKIEVFFYVIAQNGDCN